jgi:RND family efflux transporter MFP subunit
MRKQTDQESLCNAGGVNEEAVRAGRFAIEAAGQRIGLMVKELEMQCVGLRDEDIIDAGVVPAIQPEARQLQLVQLAVRGLAAERDGAVARLDAARKELASASWSLSELRIASPMDGVVGARYVEPGQRVKREEALCTVIDAGSLFAVVPVPESEAASMTPGMKATITVDAVDGVYEGVIDMISPLADSRSASCTARIALLKPARALRPGMFARVSVRNGTADRVIVVPAGSLTEIDGDSGRLFVVVNQCLAERRVRLGEPVDDGWIVAQGIAGGDVVVDVPGADMKAGDHVSIISP